MATESQAEINARLTAGVASNTASIALLAEGTSTRYKGVKATVADLPSSGNFTGDLWAISSTNPCHGYFWNGTAWEDGGVITKGADGADGEDGVSPAVTTTAITGGHRVTITDKDHPSGQSFDVMDGAMTGLDEQPTEGSSNAAKSGGIVTFVNSSVATNTANFKGTLDAATDLGLTKPATTSAIATALNAHTFSPAVTNNDYCFVVNTDTDGNTLYQRFKATVSGSTATWAWEYTLNNSSFTAAQWAAIQSGITAAHVTKLDGITSTKIDNWDNAATNSHTHSNKSTLDGITPANVSNWNSAASNSHTHSNKSVLDSITTTPILNKGSAVGISILSSAPSTYESGVVYFIK